ncbi:cysteine/glutathione ABC transporter ATP-binding protein/permease CydC [Shewanella waksmanii]|uniref:heme ABC transporter ATP-binding protein/permease CydC n=1 Tax=Shewanella waksmanii TaxID=213783 RepID=UPI00373542EB
MRVLLPFLKLFRRQWLMMATGLLLSLTTLMAGIGLLSLSGWFLSATAVAGLSVATAQAFNYFTPAGGVRFLSIARTASRYGERLATHEATFKLLTELRSWTWQRLLPLTPADMKGVRHGDLLNRLVADIDTLDHLYLRLLTPMAASLLMIGALYLFLGWIDADLAIALCSALLVVWLVLPVLFYYLGRQPGKQMVESKRQYRVLLLEYIDGSAELTLFAALSRYRQRLDNAEQAIFTSQSMMNKVTALSQALLVLCHGAAVVMMLYLAAFGVGQHTPPGPMLAMVVFMTLATIEMLMPITAAFQHLSACVQAAQRVSAVVDKTSQIQFDASATHVVKRGEIAIKEINFGYQANKSVLKGLSLSIKAGEKVALLGQTGCGKSSTVSLLTREWQAQQGQIQLDGRDIEQYSEAALRDAMTVVSQRIYLFAGTLRDNLTLAQFDTGIRPDMKRKARIEARKANDAKLIAVLEKVGLSNLLQGEQPLDNWIGEGGRQLSGGEARRIGVARALLRDTPILLLDEPTEGLDKRTEREILSTLFEFAKDKTVLMICHRLTALAQMDRVCLMEQGHIVDQGTHQQLLDNNAYYAGLHQRLAK